MKAILRTAGLELFDANGYYRTGVREVADRAGCTLPTLYYHYGSKENLFRELVYEGYRDLTARIADQIPQGLSLRDKIYFGVMQCMLLEGEDRLIFRLALKAMMGLEGPADIGAEVLTFELSRPGSINKHAFFGGKPAFSRLVSRVMGEMLISSLLGGLVPTAEDIAEEIDLLMKLSADDPGSGK